MRQNSTNDSRPSVYSVCCLLLPSRWRKHSGVLVKFKAYLALPARSCCGFGCWLWLMLDRLQNLNFLLNNFFHFVWVGFYVSDKNLAPRKWLHAILRFSSSSVWLCQLPSSHRWRWGTSICVLFPPSADSAWQLLKLWTAALQQTFPLPCCVLGFTVLPSLIRILFRTLQTVW